MQPIIDVATTPTASSDANATTTTVKPEKYRISRQELGYILGKNYRGLRKLLRLELNDAANVSIVVQLSIEPGRLRNVLPEPTQYAHRTH